MSEWQPIDSAPKNGTRLLLFVDEPIIGFWATAPKPYRFCGWTTGWETVSGYDVGYQTVGRPTHWMPLPQPPEPP